MRLVLIDAGKGPQPYRLRNEQQLFTVLRKLKCDALRSEDGVIIRQFDLLLSEEVYTIHKDELGMLSLYSSPALIDQAKYTPSVPFRL